MKIAKLILLIFITFTSLLNAQVGIGTVTPDASSILDVSSTNKGFLPPRLSSLQKNAIVSPAAGLLVYDTDTNSLWYFNGTVWTTGGAGSGGNTIYTADDVLTGDRIVSQGAYGLSFLNNGTAKTTVDGSFKHTGALYRSIRIHTEVTNIVWTATDYAVTFTENGISGIITLPDPTTNTGRILSINNDSGGTVLFGVGDGAPVNFNSIRAGTGCMFISNGTNWYPIGAR